MSGMTGIIVECITNHVLLRLYWQSTKTSGIGYVFIWTPKNIYYPEQQHKKAEQG